MSVLKFFTFSAFLSSSSAFAATPSAIFESNADQKSYQFFLVNETSEAIVCSLIEVSATVGNQDCSDLLATYKYTIKNQVLKPDYKVENSNFGIDFLALKNKADKKRSLIYCGQPAVEFNCK